jgi:hypothetical protein
MSTRTNLRPQPVIVNGNMADTLTSAPTILQSLSIVSYSFSWSGSSPDGNIIIQCSNDYSLNPNGTVNNSGTWNTMTVDLAGSPVTEIPVSGNTGNSYVDIRGTGAYAIRCQYLPTSGTGMLQAIINGKVS